MLRTVSSIKGLSQKNVGTKIFSMYGVTRDAHSSFPFHISTGLSKVEIDISNVTSNVIDDKCIF